MPEKKQRDYTADIKRILANNPKTFEFFALCLTVMIDLPESDRNIIAKLAASNAQNDYYLEMKGEKDKSLKRAFKNTIFQTLIQDFDSEKAADFVNIYTRTRDFHLRGLTNQRKISHGQSSLFKKFTYRDNQLLIEQINFIQKMKINSELLPESHLTFDRIFTLLTSHDGKNRTLASLALHFAMLTSIVAITSLSIYLSAMAILKLFSGESLKTTLPNFVLVLLFDSIAALLYQKSFIPAVFNLVTNEGIALSEKLKNELIQSIKSELKQNVTTDPHPSQPTNEPVAHENPTYHFPLFTLPTLSQASNSFIAPQIRQKTKTRPAFVAPAQPPKPKEPQERKDTYTHKNILFHRIFNQQDLPTHDFIGLDSAEIRLLPHETKKTESLLQHPTLVSKKAHSGIVNIRDEKEKNKKKLNNIGFFKVKNKGVDQRLYTSPTIETKNLDGEDVTLHTVTQIKRHVSKKNQ